MIRPRPDRRPHARLAAAFVVLAGVGCGGASDDDQARDGNGRADSTSTVAPTSNAVAQTTVQPALATTAPSGLASTTGAPDAAVDGEYQVGAATIVVDDPVRPLTVEVWFPLDPDVDATGRAAQRYSFSPTVYVDSQVAVAATADEMASDTRFPLVVYSHGSGGLRYINATYTEAVASHGYIVVATDHTGNTAVDTLAGNPLPETIFADRVDDVHRLIDAFADPAADSPASPFAAGVDPDLVAVAGHSFGGWTAIAAAIGSDDPPAITDGDPRIDAVIPIAPAVQGLFTAERLATLTQPMLVLVGTDDTTTPITPHVEDLWTETSDRPAYRVELDGAQHQSFTDVCLYQTEFRKLPDVPEAITDTLDGYAAEGCAPDDMPWQRAHEIAATYTVDFLDEVLRGDAGAVPTQTADDVEVTSR